MPISPVGHLREEEMRWEASSKPGETAQEGEPWQAGDGAPSRGFGYRNEPACGQEQDDHYDSKKGDKDRGRERRRQEWEETGEHVCGEVEESAGRCWRAPALTSYTHKKTLERSLCVYAGVVFVTYVWPWMCVCARWRVFMLVRQPWCYQAAYLVPIATLKENTTSSVGFIQVSLFCFTTGWNFKVIFEFISWIAVNQWTTCQMHTSGFVSVSKHLLMC